MANPTHGTHRMDRDGDIISLSDTLDVAGLLDRETIFIHSGKRNPFYGFCTTTCSKIRKTANGTGSKANQRDGYLVYAMRVTETMSFNDYWSDPRFRSKRSDMYASRKKAFGDNIYYKDSV